MAYSTEVMSRARARLAAMKADRESQYNQRVFESYSRVPRLREIDKQLRLTMAMAAQAVFASGGDVNTAMEEAKQKNLALQQERRELIEANFEPGWLDEQPVCAVCGGSGYLGASMCACLAELCAQEQKKELTLLHMGDESFDKFRLDFYPDRVDPKYGVNIRSVMEKTYQVCLRYAGNFSENAGNLLFSGDTGLGKTFLSACIARTVAERGYSVVYESAGHLFTKLERAKFSGDENARKECEKFTACDLLIVDDLGTEMPGQFTNAALYTLINDRLLSGKSTIISTNLNTEDIARRYTAQIASRLRGSYTRVAFLGDDIRVKKNWGV